MIECLAGARDIEKFTNQVGLSLVIALQLGCSASIHEPLTQWFISFPNRQVSRPLIDKVFDMNQHLQADVEGQVVVDVKLTPQCSVVICATSL
jgi:hypothetical protein